MLRLCATNENCSKNADLLSKIISWTSFLTNLPQVETNQASSLNKNHNLFLYVCRSYLEEPPKKKTIAVLDSPNSSAQCPPSTSTMTRNGKSDPTPSVASNSNEVSFIDLTVDDNQISNPRIPVSSRLMSENQTEIEVNNSCIQHKYDHLASNMR